MDYKYNSLTYIYNNRDIDYNTTTATIQLLKHWLLIQQFNNKRNNQKNISNNNNKYNNINNNAAM